jgi:hypothetical protein
MADELGGRNAGQPTGTVTLRGVVLADRPDNCGVCGAYKTTQPRVALPLKVRFGFYQSLRIHLQRIILRVPHPLRGFQRVRVSFRPSDAHDEDPENPHPCKSGKGAAPRVLQQSVAACRF